GIAVVSVALSVASTAGAQRSPDTVVAGRRIALDAVPLAARIALPASPDWIGLGFGSAWVVNYRPDRVSRINLSDNTIAAEIPIGKNGCLGIIVGDSRIWVPTCGEGVVTEIDPATNTIVRRVPVPIVRGREGSFAFADNSFWIPDNATDSTSSTIARVDAASGNVLAHISTGARSDVAVAGFGGVWVASSKENVVSRIDPATNKVVARIPVGPSPK